MCEIGTWEKDDKLTPKTGAVHARVMVETAQAAHLLGSAYVPCSSGGVCFLSREFFVWITQISVWLFFPSVLQIHLISPKDMQFITPNNFRFFKDTK